MEKLIDEVWNLSLNKISKKEATVVRSSLGDDIDLIVPQTKTLLLLEANPTVISNTYNSSYVSANRNAHLIMKTLGMPADYFWKFEYWPRERAFATLRRVVNRVFSTMMNQNKEGGLDISDINIEPMRFTVTFKDCAECAGITAEKGFCYYHAATFSGIIAALLNKDMSGFEAKCQAKGDDACIFLIGKKDDPEISAKVSDYLIPTKVASKIDERLNNCLQGHSLRGLGNLVDITYYQLIVANCVANNAELFASASLKAGIDYGTKLAPIIADFFQDNQLSVIRKYYNQLRQLNVTAIEVGADIDIILTEHPLLATVVKRKELLSFLFGELQGLVSKLLDQKMVYQESWLENSTLRVRLSPQV